MSLRAASERYGRAFGATESVEDRNEGSSAEVFSQVFSNPRPRSSADRASASGAVCAGSSPAEGACRGRVPRPMAAMPGSRFGGRMFLVNARPAISTALAAAAAASAGAGLVHAAAAGSLADDPAHAGLFAACAVAELGWAAWVVFR